MINEYYLQDKRTYVGNDILWWAKDGRGYTTDLSKAHIYTRKEALEHNEMRCTDVPWPKDYIDGKTRPAVDMQYVDIQVALSGENITLSQPERPRRKKYKCENCGKYISDTEYYATVYQGECCSNCRDEYI